MGGSRMLRPLAEIPSDHPSLFGESRLVDSEPLVIAEHATVLPRITINGSDDWALRFSQGVFDANGDHLEALNDQRAHRRLFYPASRLENAAGYKPEGAKKLKFMLYGGTLYEHFGDMLVDTCRAYQLLRLYRHSKEPIWFHYAVPRHVKSLRLSFIEQWLNCLGLAKRFRLIRRPMMPRQLVSCPQIYRDLRFISRDYPAAARAALHPSLRRSLAGVERQGHRIAYLSRHRLNQGTSKFVGEEQLVEQLRSIPAVDIICPEELSFEDKLALWRSHAYIVGFPQGCLMLKPFVPQHNPAQLARQVFLLAGPSSLPSTWLNVEKACAFGDLYLDCHGDSDLQDPNPAMSKGGPGDSEQPFTRANPIDVATIVDAIRALAAAPR
ncbi:MAG: glycosyltransferase 61 family protein [Cyanobacteriota bacterium]